MSTFFMFGNYTTQAIEGIGTGRTKAAAAVIKNNGGTVKASYTLLGDYDLVLIVELPGVKEAINVSLALTRLTGVKFKTTEAVTVDEFDKLIRKK